MTKAVFTGLDLLQSMNAKKFPGRIGLLCHQASVNRNVQSALEIFDDLFKERFTTIFSPQHGLVGNVQDNMIESDHFIHPYFKRKVYSLYSEQRSPKKEWLEELDYVFVDLQDVGCRVYTYIYTLSLLLEVAQDLDVKVVILDRPNPARADLVEGNILDLKFKSFVGLHPLPARHGLTMGEFALFAKTNFYPKVKLEIIKMEHYHRHYRFNDTQLPWVLPSPNLATPEASFTFITTVYFEGTNISEGRGTTKALECFGHPHLTEAYKLCRDLTDKAKKWQLEGFIFRPMVFRPTFQKHHGIDCQGAQIHVTDSSIFRPWRLAQFLLLFLREHLGDHFKWKEPPYEYEYHQMPIDLIQGSDLPRLTLEAHGEKSKQGANEKSLNNVLSSTIDLDWCHDFEQHKENKMDQYQKMRTDILLY